MPALLNLEKQAGGDKAAGDLVGASVFQVAEGADAFQHEVDVLPAAQAASAQKLDN